MECDISKKRSRLDFRLTAQLSGLSGGMTQHSTSAHSHAHQGERWQWCEKGGSSKARDLNRLKIHFAITGKSHADRRSCLCNLFSWSSDHVHPRFLSMTAFTATSPPHYSAGQRKSTNFFRMLFLLEKSK